MSTEPPKKNVILNQAFHLGLAVCAAFMIKYWVLQIFVIPTGSMEPTLHGRMDGGDRLLATNFDYLWREPKRWEITVFLYPYDQDVKIRGEAKANKAHKGENYIKRCVGLPGETILFSYGDLYARKTDETAWIWLRKPETIQRTMWQKVYSETFRELSLNEFEFFSKLTGNWEIKNDALHGTAGSIWTYRPHTRNGKDIRGIPDRTIRAQTVKFKCPQPHCDGRLAKYIDSQKITGRCPSCGQYLLERNVVWYQRRNEQPRSLNETGGYDQAEVGERGDSYFNVSDLRLAAEVKLSPAGSVRLQLDDDRRSISCKIENNGNVSLLVDKQEVNMLKDAFSNELPVFIELWRWDGQYLVYVRQSGNEKRLFHEEDANINPRSSLGSPDTSASILVDSGDVTIHSINLDRDIHYYPRQNIRSHDDNYPAIKGNGEIEVPENTFLMLGDNCGSSQDSRVFGAVPRKNLRGPAHFIWWPLHRMRWLY